MFEEFVESFCRTAGGSDSTDSEVKSAEIWVRGVVTRIVRKVQLCSRSDSWALEVEETAECFNEITANPILRLCFNCPREIPKCSVYVFLKQYTVFNNVDIVENILNLEVAREHFDVLPKGALWHAVNYQIMYYTTLYAPRYWQWQKV